MCSFAVECHAHIEFHVAQKRFVLPEECKHLSNRCANIVQKSCLESRAESEPGEGNADRILRTVSKAIDTAKELTPTLLELCLQGHKCM